MYIVHGTSFLNVVCAVSPGYIKGVSVPAAQPGLMTGGVMRSYQVEGMEWIKVGVVSQES